ncbi:MAG: PAS domain S-box protein, partial [Methanococcaceae archaeon]
MSNEQKTILLVEDELIVAMSGKLTLKKYGYNVITADTGEKAIDIFKKDDSIDLILMDIDLGTGIDGTEAAISILKERFIPILFLSSHIEPEIVEKTEKITSYGYVVKNTGNTVLDASIKMAFKLFDAREKAESELTERTRAEEELSVSEIRYRRLFESAQDGILILNAETGIIDDVNPFLVEMLGYSKAQFMEKEIWKLGFFKDIVANRDKFLELQQKGYVRYENLPLETSDGRNISVEFVSNVYLVDQVKVIQCNIRDITDRKKSEAGLEKTRKELAVIKITADEVGEFAENIINTVREPLLVLDKNLRAVKASRSFFDFFRTTYDETIGKLIYDLGNKQWDIPKLRELLETILPEKTTLDNYEVEHDFATIGKRIMLLNARQIESALGKEKIILLAIEDITERKRAEEEIKLQNELLQDLNASKDKFFSIIAHDLKSPFQGFLGLTKIMADDTSTFTALELSDLAANMHKTANNLFSMLRNLLEWAQMQKGIMDFKPIELSLSDM